MNKPNTFESLEPFSRQYSLRTDLKLNAWLLVAMLVGGAASYGLRGHAEWSAPVRAAIALTPVVPGLLYVWRCARFARGMDELQRRLQLEAALFASFGTLLVGVVINVLNAHGVAVPGLPHGLELGSAFFLLFFLWLVGVGLRNCRYQ